MPMFMQIWKRFHQAAEKSRQAAEHAEEASANMTSTCAKANSHKLHIEHVIKRAAVHTEEVKASLLSEIKARALLVPKLAEKEGKAKELKQNQVFEHLGQ